MNKAMAKTLFTEGVLKRVLVTKDLEKGFNMAFSRSEKGEDMEMLEVERGGVRQFKTADAALGMAKEIGFQVIEFHI